MKIDLYVKVWCPWCVKAIAVLDALACEYTVHDIERDQGAAAAMLAISGQTRVPTMQVGSQVLSDFGPEEVKPFLIKLGLIPHSSSK